LPVVELVALDRRIAEIEQHDCHDPPTPPAA
jgi:hypothetical protein